MAAQEDLFRRIVKVEGEISHDGGPRKLHELLLELQLVPQEGTYMCPTCERPLKLYELKSSPDGMVWQCAAKVSLRKQKARICGTRVAYRFGTFLARSHLSAPNILYFCRFWLGNVSLNQIALMLRISKRTCVDWASFCREVVYHAMYARKEPLGGPGKVVEIDESKFGRRKYNRGHRVEGQWVFGGYERGSGKVFLVPVDKRDRATLVPLIQEWILPGTTIISHCWKAYERLRELDFEHLKANHSVTFKDSVTDTHTSSIESMWRGAKLVVSASGQRKKEHIPGNLALYMFFKRCRELGLDATTEFCKYAGEIYDPRRSRTNPPEAGVEGSDSEAGSPAEAVEGFSNHTPAACTSHSAVGECTSAEDPASITSPEAADHIFNV